MSDVAPALTPEEWARMGGGGKPKPNDEVFVEGDNICVVSDSGRVSAGYDRHALAALCLHGQPFGFTWEDVDLLVQLGGYEAPGFSPHYEDGRLLPHPAVKSLADRIAALLPPREQHP
jgi:hypothetical protein